MLQPWYRLSGPGLEEALADRLSFRHFVGLALDARGLIVKSGTLIDASLVAADARRPRRDEPKAGRSDPDADWIAMPEKPLFGDGGDPRS